MIKIDKELIKPLLVKAQSSNRQRCNFNFHKIPDDTLQRMLNVLNTETYVMPHKHESPDKREAFVLIEGKIAVVEFDNNGNPIDHIILSRDLANYGCEIAPGIWHTIICLENGTVIYEIKDGPYDMKTDKIFAPWAPVEGESGTAEYNEKILRNLNIR